MKKRILSIAALFMCSVIMLTACGGGAADTKETKGADKADDTMKVALCVTGAVNDMGFCQSAYDALVLLEEKYGCEIAYTENVQPADMAAVFTDYAANGYDIVFGHGFQFGDPALEVAPLYPDTYFICAESNAAADNVATYIVSCEQGGYVEGVLAARMTESGKVGYIGPVEGASLIKIMNGFEDGAKSVNPDIEVQTAWTGSFTDTALAKEAAQAMIDSGVDVVAHDANECGNGAIFAAQEAGVWAMGDSYDQHELAPETVLTSSMYHFSVVYETAYLDVVNGNFKGELEYLGMAEGAVEMAPYYDLESEIPEEVRTEIDELIASIVSGEFVVPLDETLR